MKTQDKKLVQVRFVTVVATGLLLTCAATAALAQTPAPITEGAKALTQATEAAQEAITPPPTPDLFSVISKQVEAGQTSIGEAIAAFKRIDLQKIAQGWLKSIVGGTVASDTAKQTAIAGASISNLGLEVGESNILRGSDPGRVSAEAAKALAKSRADGLTETASDAQGVADSVSAADALANQNPESTLEALQNTNRQLSLSAQISAVNSKRLGEANELLNTSMAMQSQQLSAQAIERNQWAKHTNGQVNAVAQGKGFLQSIGNREGEPGAAKAPSATAARNLADLNE
jgi:hypothetical protein